MENTNRQVSLLTNFYQVSVTDKIYKYKISSSAETSPDIVRKHFIEDILRNKEKK